MNSLLERITLNAEVCGGKPTIRNMRFTVTQMLQLLASGMSHNDILDDYPYVEEDDIKAVLIYAALYSDTKSVVQAK